MTLRRKLQILAAVVVVGAGGAGGALTLQGLSGPGRQIPTARVQRGNLELRTHTAGEMRAARSGQLTVPPVSGTLQIVLLLKTGTIVKEGDIVIDLDPSEQEYLLDQASSQMLQAEQEITKARADAAVQAAEDKVNLLKARFDLRRAELEVGRNELLSAIDGRKNQLALEEARRRLEQLEKDFESRRKSSEAALAVLIERRNKERLSMVQAEQSIKNLTIRAPFSGMVAVKENRDGLNFGFPGMTVPEYRAGDQVSSGRFIAEVLEVSQMEILARVSENERGNILPGQSIQVRVDAVPGPTLNGKVKNVAGMASRDMWSSDGQRRFDATFQVDAADPRLRPGVSAQIIIVGNQVRDALYIPRLAVFEKDGKPVVFLRQGEDFEAREVRIAHRTESQVVVEGLAEGAEVALANPEKDLKRPGKSGAPAAPSIGAGTGQ